MGDAPEGHVVIDAHATRHDRMLRDQRYLEGSRAFVHLGKRFAENRHRTARGTTKAGDRFDQRRLAGAVRSDNRGPDAGLEDQRHVRNKGLRASTDTELIHLDRTHTATGRRRLRMTTNTGAPINAVTTPSGNSDGAMTVRAI